MLINANMVKQQLQMQQNAPAKCVMQQLQANFGIIAKHTQQLAQTHHKLKPAGLQLTLLTIASLLERVALQLSAMVMNHLPKLQPHLQQLELELHGMQSSGPRDALSKKFKT
jgi:predicted transcriptional regulator